MDRPLRAKLLTVSDSAFRGEREDLSGQAVRRVLEQHKLQVLMNEVVPDELDAIKKRLRAWCKEPYVDVILTTGGTGVGPRDVTPEATRPLLEREIPGLAELMRAEGIKKTRRAALSRGLAGVSQGKLILNLPGSPRGAGDSLESVVELLPHIVDLIRGKTRHEK